MKAKSALEVAEAFLNVLWAERPPGDKELAVALDRLLASTHEVPDSDGSDQYVSTPVGDWQSLHKEIGARFPDYGYYSAASPLDVDESACHIGDAIDDLADITRDLRDVVWLWHTHGRDEATWHFRFNYEIHWGRHARQLALYLHERIGASRD